MWSRHTVHIMLCQRIYTHCNDPRLGGRVWYKWLGELIVCNSIIVSTILLLGTSLCPNTVVRRAISSTGLSVLSETSRSIRCDFDTIRFSLRTCPWLTLITDLRSTASWFISFSSIVILSHIILICVRKHTTGISSKSKFKLCMPMRIMYALRSNGNICHAILIDEWYCLSVVRNAIILNGWKWCFMNKCKILKKK